MDRRAAERRFYAVQAFLPQAETLAPGKFISSKHFKSKGFRRPLAA